MQAGRWLPEHARNVTRGVLCQRAQHSSGSKERDVWRGATLRAASGFPFCPLTTGWLERRGRHFFLLVSCLKERGWGWLLTLQPELWPLPSHTGDEIRGGAGWSCALCCEREFAGTTELGGRRAPGLWGKSMSAWGC